VSETGGILESDLGKRCSLKNKAEPIRGGNAKMSSEGRQGKKTRISSHAEIAWRRGERSGHDGLEHKGFEREKRHKNNCSPWEEYNIDEKVKKRAKCRDADGHTDPTSLWETKNQGCSCQAVVPSLQRRSERGEEPRQFVREEGSGKTPERGVGKAAIISGGNME